MVVCVEPDGTVEVRGTARELRLLARALEAAAEGYLANVQLSMLQDEGVAPFVIFCEAEKG
jgi:hypothetical protein